MSFLFAAVPCSSTDFVRYMASDALTNYRTLYCFPELKLLPVIFLNQKREERALEGRRGDSVWLCVCSWLLVR